MTNSSNQESAPYEDLNEASAKIIPEQLPLSLELSQKSKKRSVPVVQWRFSPGIIRVRDTSDRKTIEKLEEKDQESIGTMQSGLINAKSSSDWFLGDKRSRQKIPKSQNTNSEENIFQQPIDGFNQNCLDQYTLVPSSSDTLPSSPLKKESRSTSQKSRETLQVDLEKDDPDPFNFDIEDLADLGSRLFSSSPEIRAIKTSDPLENYSSNPDCSTLLSADNKLMEDLNLDDGLLESLFIDENIEGECLSNEPAYFYRIKIAEISKDGDHKGSLMIIGLITDLDKLIRIKISGDWKMLDLKEDQIVHVVRPKVCNDFYVVDNEDGFVIVYPDNLISNTIVADSISCLRRAVLSTRIQPSVEDNKPSISLICGSIVHDIVEVVLHAGKYDHEIVLNSIEDLIIRNLQAIYCCKQNESFVRNEVLRILKPFEKWCGQVLRQEPHPTQATLTDQISSKWSHQSRFMAITGVAATEDGIWSHALGLKGKVDATVYARFQKGLQQNGARLDTVIVPFELKTSKSTTSVAHRAQTLLYSLLVAEKYSRENVFVGDFGLLYYVAADEMIRVTASRPEIRGLIMARNRLAAAIALGNQLPPPIKNEHLCRQCFQLESCLVYHKMLENGSASTSASAKHFETRLGHLNDSSEVESCKRFFEKWNRLVGLEEAECLQSKLELWLKTPQERVANGRCLLDVKIKSCEKIKESSQSDSLARYLSIFLIDSEPNLTNCISFARGEPVVISNSKTGLFGIAIGFVQKIESITDQSQHRLVQIHTDRPITASAENSFRIDKDELTVGFGLMKANIVKLFVREYEPLMRILVMDSPPKFSESCLIIPDDLFDAYKELDLCQQSAIQKVLQAINLTLILGMPGTGKSTTLAFLIRLLVHQGKSVLLSSYTHSAVDNILKKILNQNSPSSHVKCARLGTSDRVDQDLYDIMIDKRSFETVFQLEEWYLHAKVVGCTCLGIKHPLLMERRFDYCIIDEASQINLPTCIGPLRLAEKFILVGDHYQLPPLVRNREAIKDGLNVSLFESLAVKFPEAVCRLEQQYRMNHGIMDIANLTIYENQLKSGSDSVSQSCLNIEFARLACKICQDCWLKKTLDPVSHVIFVDTDELGGFLETSVGVSFSNPTEANIIRLILESLQIAQMNLKDVCVISPYRPQLKLIEASPDVEVSTVDQFQGRDKSCVILSMLGELLKDWKRINVAITRAKHKLIIVGSQKTLSTSHIFSEIFLHLGKQFIVTVPLSKFTEHLDLKK